MDQARMRTSDYPVTVVHIEKLLSFFSFINHVLRGIASDKYVELKQFILVISREKWDTCVKFCDDTAETPHINLVIIGDAKSYLRSPVESRLHIGKALFGSGATGAEIYDLNFVSLIVCVEDILRLQVAVDDLHVLEVIEALHYLEYYGSYIFLLGEALEVMFFHVTI